MAWIVDGILLRGGKKAWYVDLWESDDSESAFEFHEVPTEEARDLLIARLEVRGHVRIPDGEEYGEE